MALSWRWTCLPFPPCLPAVVQEGKDPPGTLPILLLFRPPEERPDVVAPALAPTVATVTAVKVDPVEGHNDELLPVDPIPVLPEPHEVPHDNNEDLPEGPIPVLHDLPFLAVQIPAT